MKTSCTHTRKKNGGICVLYMAKVDTEKYCNNCMAYHNKKKDNNDNTQS